MKLLIDIPDDQYEFIKLSDKNTFASVSSKECMLYAIKNGTPVSTDGDLISRSDLRQAINKVVDEEIGIDEKWAKGLKYSINIIDSAPKVNIIQHKDWYLVNMAGAKELLDRNRPHSEWKVNNYGEHICPICGHYALYDECQDNDYYEVQSNFCPNCGADMRGKEE